MIEIEIPGHQILKLEHLVLDYNGTLALDGKLIPGVAEQLQLLDRDFDIHVLTADTFGSAEAQLRGLPCQVSIMPKESQEISKHTYLQKLGADRTVCIGNGHNDRIMLKEAALGIVVILSEGAAVSALKVGDVICTDILAAFALLQNPLRLVATLRS